MISRATASIIFIFLSAVLPVVAQGPDNVASANNIEADSASVRKRTFVYLLHADLTKFDKERNPDAHILVGDVSFRRDSMYMYCDSAYFYTKKNSVEAFGSVKMEQGDTLFLYGDYLDYNGDTNIARVRGNVRLEDRTSVLETDSLNFNRNINLGYYFSGGTLYDEQNTLDSYWGEYNVDSKLAVFKDEVVLQNPQFTLETDTLRYNTVTNVATIVGPTDIYSDNNKIYSELGYYNTNNRQAILLDRSVLSNDSKNLTGDSLFYDAEKGISEAYGNIFYSDTINHNLLAGEYAYFNELNDSAYATDRAVVMDYSQGDTLYMHADTIWAVTRNNETDSLYRQVRACHRVRAFRSDLQAVCDSLVFDSRDSCMTMYTDPILWTQGQQLLGEEMKIYMDTASIDWIHVINQTLYAEQLDTAKYNQIKGQEMKFFFKEKKLHEMQVIGSVEVVYYVLDDDSLYVGVNTTSSGRLSAFMENNEVSKIVVPTQSSGIFYPVTQIPFDKSRLSNFAWFDYVRPLNRKDIFNWRGKNKDMQLKKTVRKEVPLPTLDRFKNSK